MENRILTFINGNEKLKESIPKYIEVFTRFYGESKRKEIEEKFNNALFIGYNDPTKLEQKFYELEGIKTKELLQIIPNDLLKELNLTIRDITDNKSFKYQLIQPINNAFKIIESVNRNEAEIKKEFYESGYEYTKKFFPDITDDEYKEIYYSRKYPERYKNIREQLLENINYTLDESRIYESDLRKFRESKNLLLKIDSNINENNFKELLKRDKYQKLLSIKPFYLKAYEDFEKYIEKYKKYYEEIEEIKRVKDETEKELYKELVKENIDLVSDDLKEETLKKAEQKEEIYNYDLSVRKILGYAITTHSILESFSEKSEETLKDEETNEWIKHSILEERIQYFKMQGIDLGNNYEDYENSEEVKSIIPDPKRINDLIESKNKYINKYHNSFYTSLSRHKKIEEEIELKNYIDKDPPVNAKTYLESYSFVTPNIVKEDDIYKISPLVIINFDDINDNSKDHIIIHELNHLYELSLGLASNEYYEALCGWDILQEKTNEIEDEVDTLEDKDLRKYELFNEIINEIIAQEISKLMHKDNIYIFDNPKNSRYTNTTSYEHSLFLVSDFYNEYKDKIIESRTNGNIDIILNEVGKENFDELNNLFSIYFESFGGMKIYSLLNSLNNEEDNDLTRIYYDLLEKRDLILEKMKKYKTNQEKDNYIK